MKTVLTAVCCALALTVSACGGPEESSGLKSLESSAPSDTAAETSGDPVAPPSVKPTRPKDVNSKDGATAFAVFVMQTIVYTVSTNDAEPLLALSNGTSCAGCIGLANDVQDRGSMAQVPSGDGTISDLTVEKRDADSYVSRQVLKLPEGTTVDVSSGEKGDSFDSTEAELTAVVIWTDGQWRLENYGSSDKETS